MYFQVASKMVVTSGTPAYTEAVEMSGANAALVDITSFTATGGTAVVQEGNDLENWSDNAASSSAVSGTSYGTARATAVAARYTRIKFTSSSSAPPMIVSAGVNTASL